MNKEHYTETEIGTIVIQECKLKGYSQKTIDTYLHHIKKFVSSGKTPREFLLGLIAKDKSDETVRSAGFATKFYLNTIKIKVQGFSLISVCRIQSASYVIAIII